MSTEQTGNVHNVVNLDEMIKQIMTFDPRYNPARPEFTISRLIELKDGGMAVNSLFDDAENAGKNAASARNAIYDDFDDTVTRSINAFRISGANKSTIAQAEIFVRELRGKRATPKLTDEEIAAAKEEGKEVKQNTLHNSNIDSKIDNMDKYVKFIFTVNEYSPNEPDLTKEGLKSYLANFKAAHDNAKTKDAQLDAARIKRFNILYAEDTGLIDIALGAKMYVKSAFGATSPEYKSISDIAFRKQR
jgi:hypothetical protein